jgi:hypothetical protein
MSSSTKPITRKNKDFVSIKSEVVNLAHMYVVR